MLVRGARSGDPPSLVTACDQPAPFAPHAASMSESTAAPEAIATPEPASEPQPTPAPAPEHTLTGDIRTHEGFRSRFLEHDRTVTVYLPPGYEADHARRYPVLYLHDGQNIFDRATSVGEEWHVDETAQEMIEAGKMAPVIVVGIWNTGVHRIDEYAPTLREDKGGGGKADDYGKMLVQELKPFIDQTYRTLPGAGNTAMGGSSLGGLVTMHVGLRYPTVFSRLAVLSPSVWWDDRVIRMQPFTWNADGTPKGNTAHITRLVERALKLNPKHPQACHLAIHAWEASPHPEKAIKAADTLRDLQPALGHMVHMPSHTDVRVGTWAKAVLANEKAIRADEAYRMVRPRIGFYRLYMTHSRHMLGYAAMMTGQGQKAINAMDRMAAAVPPEALKDMGPILDGYMAMPYEVRVRFGRWDEILSLPPPAEGLPLAKALYHQARGIAAAAKGDLARAYEEERRFLFARPAAMQASLGMNSGAALVAVAGPLLRGEILIREGRLSEGIEQLKVAVFAEDQLRYDEPPDWINPARHPLGAALMMAGRFAEAEGVYREDLRRLPNNGWSLYGLSQALAKQGKTKQAREASAMFAKVWADADMQITSSCLCLPGK